MRALAVFVFLLPAFCAGQSAPKRAVTDPGVVTTRQAITPAGVSSVFDTRIYGVAWSPDAARLWVLHGADILSLDWRNNQVKERLPHGGTPGPQALQTNPATGRPLIANSQRRTNVPQLLSFDENGLRPVAQSLGKFLPGALAVAAKAPLAVLPLIYENKAAVVDLNANRVTAMLETGTAPWAAAVNAAGTVAYIANLGGRPPKPGEAFASPVKKPHEKIPVDTRGVASTGTVMRFDLETGQATHTIEVGLHPSALAWDEGRNLLYIANGNSDSISIVDTLNQRVAVTLALQPFSDRVRGFAPTDLALSRDGATLYAACGGINAVAVIDTARRAISGLIPTAWYPNAVALSPDGEYLAVSALLGVGSGWRDTPKERFVHSYRGSVAVLPVPSGPQLAGYSRAVAENNRLRLAGAAPVEERAAAGKVAPVALPVRSGEPSLIEHVVYIIKENRTYDQVLGDLPQGNGDPSLTMFGRNVTPNQHKLAEEFVLFDNLYATGGNSADGHQWLTQSNEVEYVLWPGYQGRSYPYDGGDPMAYSSGGFLWDYALARGKTVRIYGEYAGTIDGGPRLELLKQWKDGEDFTARWNIKAPLDPVNRILAANYPSYSTAIPDVVRAQIFLKELAGFEKSGKLPNLMLIQLPSNHTNGTRPGTSSPRAMVADNDLAVGQIVEALTKSRFWPKMAIFIVEDDAQNGVDHVDGHRTTAFLVSPYARRKSVDSTFYSFQSINKSIELILGLPTMSLFDLIANDMRASFVDTPDFTPYTALPPEYDLFEENPPLKALSGRAREAALASAKMNWAVPDAVPTEKANRILWGHIKGWQTPYPQPRQALFSPLSLDLDDDERE
ncbi:MAG: bifunctional YncE family protein/alkaline phosphatase family protein [Acidobacteriota bacterium]